MAGPQSPAGFGRHSPGFSAAACHRAVDSCRCSQLSIPISEQPAPPPNTILPSLSFHCSSASRHLLQQWPRMAPLRSCPTPPPTCTGATIAEVNLLSSLQTWPIAHFHPAIHEIFASNAEKHPERLCVVETPSAKTPERAFTYKQINESSNQLAHHFVAHGCERGDVVMVYAHRG